MTIFPKQAFPQFGAFRADDLGSYLQVDENTKKKPERISLTENSKKGYYSAVPKSSKRIPTKVAFIPSEEERKLIQTVQSRLGINKATDVLRMGLKRLAEGVKAAV